VYPGLGRGESTGEDGNNAPWQSPHHTCQLPVLEMISKKQVETDVGGRDVLYRAGGKPVKGRLLLLQGGGRGPFPERHAESRSPS